MVASCLLGVLLEMVIQLRVQCTLGQRFLQLIDQPVLLKQRLRILSFEQLVEQLRFDATASSHTHSPLLE
jgi:hypothetical protein